MTCIIPKHVESTRPTTPAVPVTCDHRVNSWRRSMTSELPLERAMKSAITKTKQKRKRLLVWVFSNRIHPIPSALQSSYFEHAGHVSLALGKWHDPLLMLTLCSQLNRSTWLCTHVCNLQKGHAKLTFSVLRAGRTPRVRDPGWSARKLKQVNRKLLSLSKLKEKRSGQLCHSSVTFTPVQSRI